MQKSRENPIAKFSKWYERADQHAEIREANAVNLATVSADGQPANRMVLLKAYDEKGFVFYTNLNSRKGAALRDNPRAGLCFYWEILGRQIRIEGEVHPVSAEEADTYFASRPRQSRIGAWASRQSQPLQSRKALMAAIAVKTKTFAIGNIPRPEFWSGFRLEPQRMEFWRKGRFRIHDRVEFTRMSDGSWDRQLLYP